MRTTDQILELLPQLDQVVADELEDQDLDFKEWITRSTDDAVKLVIEMAVCMANGGGGTIVFGVRDRVLGRSNAILGVPLEIDVNRLKRAVYDSTDPKITPVFEELSVPEGTGRLLLMQIHPGLPPYTDTSGTGKVRIGKDCQPLTGSLRKRLMVETGETDVTAGTVPGDWQSHVSPVVMEKLRTISAAEKAPREMLSLPDADLLRGLGCLVGNNLTRAGLLLCGKPEAIRSVFPGFVWTYLRMDSDTAYSDRHDGTDALPIALGHFEDRIALDNPIRTLETGLIHAEIRAYPAIALREALLNALCHADYRLPGPILVKQFPTRLEISNPGTFIGGISPANILHHPPVPRNPALVDALARLRLVNRSNLGIGRMFESFLVEGKEPPVIQESGESIIVTLLKQDVSAPFRSFVTEQAKQNRLPGVDELLILQYLLRHTELETTLAGELCQRPEAAMRNTLSRMERDYGWIQRGGTGRGTYWTLSLPLARSLRPDGLQESVTRIDWESAKTRVLSMLKQRAAAAQPGMSNAEIRAVLKFHRNQVFKLLQELRLENPQVISTSHGAGARYEWKPE
jgi:ATP-dependent DNA helicase RecG